MHFVITKGRVNFHELPVSFRDGLTCDNALFLDGGAEQQGYNSVMTDEEAAYHEAAHAIVAKLLGYACASVSIIVANEKGDREGALCDDPQDEWLTHHGSRQQRYEDRVIILVAAEIAQRKIAPHGTWNANIGFDRADILNAVIRHIGSNAGEEAIHAERRRVVAKAGHMAGKLVAKHWDKIDRLAHALLAERKITFDVIN